MNVPPERRAASSLDETGDNVSGFLQQLQDGIAERGERCDRAEDDDRDDDGVLRHGLTSLGIASVPYVPAHLELAGHVPHLLAGAPRGVRAVSPPSRPCRRSVP